MNFDFKRFEVKTFLFYFVLLNVLSLSYLSYEKGYFFIDWVIFCGCLIMSLKVAYKSELIDNNSGMLEVKTFLSHFLISTILFLIYTYYASGKFYIEWTVIWVFLLISLAIAYTGKPMKRNKK